MVSGYYEMTTAAGPGRATVAGPPGPQPRPTTRVKVARPPGMIDQMPRQARSECARVIQDDVAGGLTGRCTGRDGAVGMTPGNARIATLRQRSSTSDKPITGHVAVPD
jgi:hypothetical protein